MATQETPKCSCYDEQYLISAYTQSNQPLYRKECRCRGTKEQEICSCGGDETKCDFYPYKRKPKPCPCCGHEEPDLRENSMGAVIRCPVCGLQTAIWDDERMAISNWNRRDGK
ncbi:MAG: Lar family restriction alleviation protein [Clostridia bacterium]|nr:Lar family restriction alleviation protein [Clostridia bacterium]